MKHLACSLACGLTLLATVQSVSAQSAPPVSVTGSYQGVTDSGGQPSEGWVLGIRKMHNKWFGVEAELNGAYGGSDHFLYATEWRDHSLLGGVRFSGTRRVAPFGRVQVGFLHSVITSQQTSEGAYYGFPFQTSSRAKSALVIQPGGGLEVRINRHFAASAGVDLQLSNLYLQARFTTGAVISFGRK